MMEHTDPLMEGMFWGGLVMAAVPILLSVGIGIYVLMRYMESRREEASEGERPYPPGP